MNRQPTPDSYEDDEPYMVMPILKHHGEGEGFPNSVRIPMRCQTQAIINHNQSLARLKKRGGLAPSEAMFILKMEKYQHVESSDVKTFFSQVSADN